jgi:two-component system NarL family sensor kinase
LLHPPDLDAVGLVSAIRWFVQKFSERTGIQIALHLPDNHRRLPQDVEIALSRIMQEALTDIHRHSGSPTATLRLEIRKAEVVMRVEDEGCGISLAILQHRDSAAAHVGVGLAGWKNESGSFGAG